MSKPTRVPTCGCCILPPDRCVCAYFHEVTAESLLSAPLYFLFNPPGACQALLGLARRYA